MAMGGNSLTGPTLVIEPLQYKLLPVGNYGSISLLLFLYFCIFIERTFIFIHFCHLEVHKFWKYTDSIQSPIICYPYNWPILTPYTKYYCLIKLPFIVIDWWLVIYVLGYTRTHSTSGLETAIVYIVVYL